MRMNDGKCDPSGVFWAGQHGLGQTPGAGTLYRFTAARSSGCAPDSPSPRPRLGRTRMYHIDTPTQRIDDSTSPRRGLGDPQPVVAIDTGDGSPDGMCVDEEGCLWVAL